MQNTMCDSTISNSLQLFQNAGFKIRVVMRDGEPWFVAKDVAACIEHSDTSAMCKLCREKDKVVASARDFDSDDLSESGNARITLISESGLYRILAKCNLPKCEPFESWVFDEVLPSIRKTGSYSVNQTQQQSMMCLPQDYESALEALLTEVRKNKALQAELDETKALLAEERKYYDMLSDAVDEFVRTSPLVNGKKVASDLGTDGAKSKESEEAYMTARDWCFKHQLPIRSTELNGRVSRQLTIICMACPDREQWRVNNHYDCLFPKWACDVLDKAFDDYMFLLEYKPF